MLVFSLFQYTPATIPLEKNAPLLDVANVPGNHKDFLSDLALNLPEVELYILLK
jgi:hypothetical protein